MEKAQPSQQPICGQEALDLLNCLTESPVDDEKCNRLLNSLKACIREKLHKYVRQSTVEMTWCCLCFVKSFYSALIFNQKGWLGSPVYR
ncbi:hypothetical protein RJ639_047383 [Escallonia herrerae]|uniref:Uncharacterized protein n=1 Tax=Escallonia herrerae TaxID=1293975 RepID=A0AA88W8E9_9ASTE|nr:hypothetical protein RJ639_047383 [Escallonia herrerae]